MTLQQIHYVLAVAASGSMNKAAEELFISQPSLTNAIKDLESEIGIKIFLRTSRGVILTKEGEEFLLYSRQLYQQYELMERKYLFKGAVKRKFGVSTQHYSFAVKAFVDTVKCFGTLNYEFAIRETKTFEVITDVENFKSEIGLLYMNDFNRKVLGKMLKDANLEFHHLIDCDAYVYIWKHHPLVKKEKISFSELADYPCLSFEQGEKGSFYFAEEILSTNDYPRMIKANDRASMLNLMVGLNGYTLCSGIICEELNGSDYIAVPFDSDENNPNSSMEVGYIKKKAVDLSDIGRVYVEKVTEYLKNAK